MVADCLQPSGQHNAALALEDAETLGALFSRIQHRTQVSRMLAAHEEIRQPRGSYAQAWEVRKRTLLTAPAGQEQKRRDAGLRRMMAYEDSHIDEKRFREMVRSPITVNEERTLTCARIYSGATTSICTRTTRRKRLTTGGRSGARFSLRAMRRESSHPSR